MRRGIPHYMVSGPAPVFSTGSWRTKQKQHYHQPAQHNERNHNNFFLFSVGLSINSKSLNASARS